MVVGRLQGAALLAESDGPVELAMKRGPTTIGADLALDDITRRLRKRGVPDVLVTTSSVNQKGVRSSLPYPRSALANGCWREPAWSLPIRRAANRPRKSLGCMKPSERLAELLALTA